MCWSRLWNGHKVRLWPTHLIHHVFLWIRPLNWMSCLFIVTNSGLLRGEGRGLFSEQQRPCWKQAFDSSFRARKINISLPGLATELAEHEETWRIVKDEAKSRLCFVKFLVIYFQCLLPMREEGAAVEKLFTTCLWRRQSRR